MVLQLKQNHYYLLLRSLNNRVKVKVTFKSLDVMTRNALNLACFLVLIYECCTSPLCVMNMLHYYCAINWNKYEFNVKCSLLSSFRVVKLWLVLFWSSYVYRKQHFLYQSELWLLWFLPAVPWKKLCSGCASCVSCPPFGGALLKQKSIFIPQGLQLLKIPLVIV